MELMLKGVIAISTKLVLIFLICLGLNHEIYAQGRLEGSYSSLMTLQEHYNYYKFKTNGEFEYFKGGSVGHTLYGLGEYKLLKNKLILNFNGASPKKKGWYKLSFWHTEMDSIAIHFIVKDVNENPLKNINLINLDIKDGIQTDENGRAMLKLPKSENDYKISASQIEYDFYDFYINGRYNYNVELILQKTKGKGGVPILNRIDTLNIKEIKKNYFIVLNKDGQNQKWKRMN